MTDKEKGDTPNLPESVVTDAMVARARDAMFGDTDYQPGYLGFVGDSAIRAAVKAVVAQLAGAVYDGDKKPGAIVTDETGRTTGLVLYIDNPEDDGPVTRQGAYDHALGCFIDSTTAMAIQPDRWQFRPDTTQSDLRAANARAEGVEADAKACAKAADIFRAHSKEALHRLDAVSLLLDEWTMRGSETTYELNRCAAELRAAQAVRSEASEGDRS